MFLVSTFAVTFLENGTQCPEDGIVHTPLRSCFGNKCFQNLTSRQCLGSQAQSKGKRKGKGQRSEVRREEFRGHCNRRNRRWQASGAQSEPTPTTRLRSGAVAVVGEDSVEAEADRFSQVASRTVDSANRGEVGCTRERSFVERARKRLAAAEDAVMKALQTKSRLECELDEGVQRLQRLREGGVAQPMDQTSENAGGETLSNSTRSASGRDQPLMRDHRGLGAREGSVAIGGVPPSVRGVPGHWNSQFCELVEQREPVFPIGMTGGVQFKLRGPVACARRALTWSMRGVRVERLHTPARRLSGGARL